jgi:D-alanyl-lipoteichoic acid acyltransferase DltB (MBOAT superfamily)
MPQFEMTRTVTLEQVSSGLMLFLWGLFQKLVVADNVAPIADSAFSNAATIGRSMALAGIVAFTIQIYGDFCGYSNMARGLARGLGFELMANFNLPYFSRTPSEFWRRWHISLSSWLRDYLYICLGGNRSGELARNRNLLLTMLLGGLWHGASWTFVAWGAWHGLMLVVYRVARIDDMIASAPAWHWRSLVVNVIAWAVTSCLVMGGWIFFRAHSFQDAGNMFGALGREAAVDSGALWLVLAYAAPMVAVEIVQRASGRHEWMSKGPLLARHTLAMSLLLSVVLFGAKGGQQFIYFDF